MTETEELTAIQQKKYNEFNVIKTRIDTEPLLNRIELYLRGSKDMMIQDKEGNIKNERIPVGVPKCNENGVQSILNWLSLVINPLTVQGNFPSDRTGYSQMYEDFIYYFRLDFGSFLMTNLDKFDISDNEYQGIIDSTMFSITAFMTRLIDNLERESYGDTTRSVETNTIKNNSGFKMLNAT